MSTEIIPTASVVYPESDGKPVGETDDHRDLLFELIFALRNWLRERTAYVAGNLFVYYEQGQPTAVVAPDVFVVFDVPQQQRRIYKTWEHDGKTPNFVIELTSAGTRYEDLGMKRVLYAELDVQEYYLFDPLGDYLKPQLRAYQLVDGELLPLPGPRFFSGLLGLELRAEGRSLRLYDAQTGERLAVPAEIEAAQQREAVARAAAEAEITRLQAEIARLRALGAP